MNAKYHDIPVIILAGGRGVRFDHESQPLPKPMIMAGGKPMAHHIIDSLSAQGFRQFMLPTGYLGEKFDEYFSVVGDLTESSTGSPSWRQYEIPHSKSVLKIQVVDTGIESHTGKRLGILKPLLGSRSFILTYGDGLSDVQMSDVIAHHERCKSNPYNGAPPPLATITAVNPPGRFGVINFFDGLSDGLVRVFGEKTSLDWINGGFIYFEGGFIETYLETGQDVNSLEDQALPECARRKQLLAYRHYGYWRCLDTRRDLEQIESDSRADIVPWLKVREINAQ